jgi:hypothetical protein
MDNLTPRQATAEIIALINARPQSPRPDDILAIVSKVASNPTACVPAIACSPLHKEVERLAGAYRKACYAHDSPTHLDDLARWDGVVRQYLALSEAGAPVGESLEANTKRHDSLGQWLCAETEAVWAKPVRNWGDVILRAAVAVHWNSPIALGDPAYPRNVLRLAVEDDPYDGYDVHALAHVIRAILDLAGIRFDPEGRLLSTEARNG